MTAVLPWSRQMVEWGGRGEGRMIYHHCYTFLNHFVKDMKNKITINAQGEGLPH